MTNGVAAPGHFEWRDLNTTDPAAAKAFYGALFGWTYAPFEMGDWTYEISSLGETQFGGLVPIGPDRAGTPSSWISYISVADVDKSAAKVTELGGTVYVPPADIPDVGRFAVAADPEGAVFSPFRSLNPSAPPYEVPPAGSVVWNEVLTSDVEAAKKFYGDVIGWQFEDANMGGPGPYTILKQGEVQEAGLMGKPDPSLPSTWIIYFHVDDIDASLAKISSLGGQKMGEIIDVPTIGRVGWAFDPTGALFALHENPK
jgi:predicted enzyme related to lactoylglutathione lyase